MTADLIPIDHPGVILREEFLEPLGISQQRLAEATGLSKGRISEIVHGKRAITADTGLRISRALGLSDGYFYGLQADYNVRIAQSAFLESGVEIISMVTSQQ